MEKLSIWKLIKYGFWLGVGFIIPQLFVMYAGTAATIFMMPSMLESSFDFEEESSISEMDSEDSLTRFGFSSYDMSDEIEIQSHRVQREVNRVLVLGSIINNAEKSASSIQIEAELMNENGEFVYECSDYISQKIRPGQAENFQINCGCGDNPMPEFSTINVRVTSASSL